MSNNDCGDYARVKGVKIGVENEGGEYRDYIQLIKTTAHTSVCATIDVGHGKEICRNGKMSD